MAEIKVRDFIVEATGLNSVYVDYIPKTETLPCISFSQIGGRTNQVLCGGISSEDDNNRFQIDLYSKTAAERAKMASDMRKAIDNSDHFMLVDLPISSRQYELGLYVLTFDIILM